MSIDLGNVENVVAAVSGLGIAAFALVDATKIGRNGGISNSGYRFIENSVRQLFPNASGRTSLPISSGEKKLLDILHGYWINGSPLGDQKAIAKSLIKLRLTEQTAAAFAEATYVDAKVLENIAKKMTSGTGLTQEESNTLGRFDLALTAILDEGYQRADQRYRNTAKVLASFVAVVLALLGGWSISPSNYFYTADMWKAILCGLLAIPLAPISKDLTSALAAGVKLAQVLRK